MFEKLKVIWECRDDDSMILIAVGFFLLVLAVFICYGSMFVNN